MRRIKRIAVDVAYWTAGCLVVTFVAFPGVAFAGIGPGQTCANPGSATDHQNATMCINGQNGEVYGGAFAQFTNETLVEDTYEATRDGHINAEMWAYTSSVESRAWVEMGLRAGIYHDLDPDSCHCQAYARFWAEIGPSHGEVAHLIAYTSANGTNHSYEIQRNSANTHRWDVYVDFNLKGSTVYQTSDRMYEIAVGLETVVDWSNHNWSGEFDFRTLEYRLLTSSTWPKWPYQRNYNGYKCTSTNVPPCLWSRVVSTYEFKAMKVPSGSAVPTS